MEKINWKTFAGEYIPVNKMTNTHIINTFNCLCGTSQTYIPSNWCGRTHHDWKNIFENELHKRGYEIHLSQNGIKNQRYILVKIQ
jgi:hypothetical protein